MTTIRRTIRAVMLGLVPGGVGFALAAPGGVAPARVWSRLDWEDLILRFAVAGMLVFFLNLVCSMLNQTLGHDDLHQGRGRHGFRSWLRPFSRRRAHS